MQDATPPSLTPRPCDRIVVVGVTSTGKSTLAAKLAGRFGVPLVELDALYWEPRWQPVPLEIFRERVDRSTSAPSWVVAGNYSKARDLIWPRAQLVIWLDYPRSLALWRLIRRTFRRWWSRELLWGTNRENLWDHFRVWSEKSLVHWLFKSYRSQRQGYPPLLEMPEHRHLAVLRFRHPRDLAKWWETLGPA